MFFRNDFNLNYQLLTHLVKSFQMEFLGQLNLIIHVIAGGGMLVTAPLAFLINTKNVKNHRTVGKVFNYCMAIVGITSFFSFLKHPTDIFRQFLLAIAILTAYNVIKGVRAIQIMKGSKINRFDFINLYALTLAGLFLTGAAVYSFFNYNISITIIFGVFGVACLAEFPGQWKRLRTPLTDKMEWFRIHIGAMMGAFIASVTAFTVNAVPWLPDLLKWFGPTIILVPLIIYYTRKFAPKKKKTS